MADNPNEPKIAPPSTRGKLRYQDRRDVSETFADSIRSCVFDGHNARIEFTVGRFDESGAPGMVEGRQVPVCRLVLNAPAMLELFNRLGQIAESMHKAGLLKMSPLGAPKPPAS